jgi:hypothetical protein
MQGIDNKKVFILIGIFVVGMSLYNYFTKYQPTQESERFTKYLANINKPISASDSLSLNQFYKKIEHIYLFIFNDSIAKPFLNKGLIAVSTDFEPQVVSLELLDFTFDGHFVKSSKMGKDEYYKNRFNSNGLFYAINHFFGEASFDYDFSKRKWHAGILNEIIAIEKDRYLMVLATVSRIEPEISGVQGFISGKYKGRLYAADLKTGQIVALSDIIAENDQTVLSKKYIEGDAIIKLKQNLVDNVLKAVSRQSERWFGKALPDIEMKIRGLVNKK